MAKNKQVEIPGTEKTPAKPKIRRKLWERIGALADELQELIPQVYAMDGEDLSLSTKSKTAHAVLVGVTKALRDKAQGTEASA